MKFHITIFFRILIFAVLLVSLLGGVAQTKTAYAAVTTFDTGSLIIPMDTGTNGQNSGMLRAYGLVYDLLKHDVPVYWVINPSKSSNGDDFSISLTNQLEDVRTSATLSPRTYRGGPFIIDSADADAALPIIQSWQATAGDATAVHKLIGTETIGQDVARILIRAPRIAILADGNEQVAFNNLNAAGIPDASGGTWSASSPDVLSENDVVGATTTSDVDGALFYSSGLTRYCYFVSMHYNTTSDTTEVVAETRSWLAGNSNALAFMQCESARVFENDANGFFLTNAGLDDDGSATTNPNNRVPSHPLTQLDGTFDVDSGAVDSMRANDAPGATPDYKTGVQTLINDNSSALTQNITLLIGNMDGNASNGKLVYLAGHDYSVDLPITSNPQTNGARIFLNAIFYADCAIATGQDDVDFTLSAPSSVNPDTIEYTLEYTNPGPRPVENVRITDVLPAGSSYIDGSASITPTTTSGDTLTWELPSLDSGESGSLTFSVTVTANGDYENSAEIEFSHLAVRSVTSNSVTTTVSDPLTGTPTSTATATPTSTVTNTPTMTSTPTSTLTNTATSTATATPTSTLTSTATPLVISMSFVSSAANDGWILESRETSNVGGSINGSGTILNIGDDGSNRQYRAVLSFDTSALPNNAIIDSVVLKVKQSGMVGVNPFGTHGSLLVDIKKPYFGTALNLSVKDFNAPANLSGVGMLNLTFVNNWYSANFGNTVFSYINLNGTTQLRIRFMKNDDNDKIADYLKIFSGNAASDSRPILIIQYHLP